MSYIIHAGNSRCYRIRQNKIRQLTRDHSLVQELVDSKKLSKEGAKAHPMRHLVWALGSEPPPTYAVRRDAMKEGDLFLLCSDGLHQFLTEAEMCSLVLKNYEDLDRACQKLVRAAKQAGSRDDVTAALIEVTDVRGTRRHTQLIQGLVHDSLKDRAGSVTSRIRMLQLNPRLAVVFVTVAACAFLAGYLVGREGEYQGGETIYVSQEHVVSDTSDTAVASVSPDSGSGVATMQTSASNVADPEPGTDVAATSGSSETSVTALPSFPSDHTVVVAAFSRRNKGMQSKGKLEALLSEHPVLSGHPVFLMRREKKDGWIWYSLSIGDMKYSDASELLGKIRALTRKGNIPYIRNPFLLGPTARKRDVYIPFSQ